MCGYKFFKNNLILFKPCTDQIGGSNQEKKLTNTYKP